MREQIVAALDVGTSKICCLIARVNGAERPRVIGIGHQVSKGLKSGTVIDMEETETSIRAAVDAAERMAGGSPINEVYVNISSGQPVSRHYSVEVDVAGHEISQLDMDRVLAAGQENLDEGERFILHSRLTNFSIDGVSGTRDPRGMFGKKLGVDMHISSMAVSPLKNIQMCLNRCHLTLASAVLSPYASGLSALVADERELGSICVDIGGGLTTVSAFKDNEFIFGDIIPVGGQHVTRDIAQGLSIPLAKAERLKVLYGSCVPSRVADLEQIDIVQTGEDGEDHATRIPRSMLTSIIGPRVEEILEMVRDRLIEVGASGLAGRRIILTGGASQIRGLEELAAKVFSDEGFDCHIRIGRPISVDGLPDAASGPIFSTCVGLINYAAQKPDEVHFMTKQAPEGGLFARMGQWVKENF